MIGVKHYLALFVMCVHIRCVTALSLRYTLRREEYRVIDDYASLEVDCSSLMSCTAVCSQNNTCWTVSYKQAERRCILSIARVTDSFFALQLLVSESGWVTISKAVYKGMVIRGEARPNMFMIGGLSVPYQATFSDAATLCAEFQTVLASPAELFESMELGLDMCRCGWLSDETNGFVLQRPSQAAGRAFIETFCTVTLTEQMHGADCKDYK